MEVVVEMWIKCGDVVNVLDCGSMVNKDEMMSGGSNVQM